jgi:hypothetical protein
MNSPSSIAATLRPEARRKIAIEALSKRKPITHLAKEYQVSRKFICPHPMSKGESGIGRILRGVNPRRTSWSRAEIRVKECKMVLKLFQV